ncbi:hypothetical protein EV700_2703 [Fluviicoccus keumensis]|uniref:START domain-containing protein n=1 Tax=Fluviicoccus keumensis TaxID=1435465 RepID=A0A4V2G3S7_9GAMM|nr:START domain-containing protein [Fluviicoccus keumensis]RZU38126.1 hypothetical protein EV700_2703 [Fluviicoccus keumensis]
MKFLTGLCLVMATAVTAPTVWAVDNDLKEIRPEATRNEWQLVKNDATRNIKTYIKQNEDGKRIHFKIDAVIEGSMEKVARVHFDIDNIKRWYWETTDSRLLKKVSDREYYYYMSYNAPVSTPDRDAILHAVVEPYSPKKGYMEIKVNAVPEFMPPKPNLVRVQAQDINIRFTPVTRDKTHLEAEGFVDPGGMVPTWAMNFIQRNAPYTTMLGLQRMVATTSFRDGDPSPFAISE